MNWTVAEITTIVVAGMGTFSSLLNLFFEKRASKRNEVALYRYEQLYSLIIDWDKYDSYHGQSSPGATAFYSLAFCFSDNMKRFNLAEPLLDNKYSQRINEFVKKWEQINQQVLTECAVNTTGSNEKMVKLIEETGLYVAGCDLGKLLKETILEQLTDLSR